MTASTAILNETREDGRARRCIVTAAVLPEAELIRFVEGPEGIVVPDIAAKLPGRGLWVRAARAVLELAVRKNHFARAARKPLKAPADLVARLELLLVRHMAADLGLARRSGALILGFDQIARAFAAKSPPALLVEAADGAADGRRKLLAVALAHGQSPKLLDCLNSEELGLALGRENVVHAALKSGQLAERLQVNAGRLAGLRAANRDGGLDQGRRQSMAGPIPAPKGTNERDE